ncbi:hypothetical protein H2509_00570 [Stappia sp. F7233]|uniref:Uncharacterized protein n=1 Tax=Stappia albiluteola TaxID=2758565 RepID=A0A839A9I5_9HYPH|nr:hypothetical protein [Stappia albiluteola]MBA5775612.1 hypothetical protein [Stappia albiluteola]
MKEKEEQAAALIPPPTNDNGPDQMAGEEAERHLDTIARAIGRHIAREHIRAWERVRRKRAANDNRPEKEGREPDG